MASVCGEVGVKPWMCCFCLLSLWLTWLIISEADENEVVVGEGETKKVSMTEYNRIEWKSRIYRGLRVLLMKSVQSRLKKTTVIVY